MAEIANPHDRLFKALLDRPSAAGALLRERLPAEVAARLSDDPPELVPQTFVDPGLAEVYTDRLYRVRLLDGRPALIYALVEHKSWLDPRVGLQLLRYLVRVLEWADAEATGKGPLPAVVPLVIYHGKAAWPGPGRFLSLVDADEALSPHLLDFRYEIVDLGRVDDEDLSRHVELRLGLLLLKHVFLGTDLGRLLDEEAVATLQRDRDFLAMLVRYLLRVLGREKRPMIIDMVSRVYPGQGEAVVASYGEELINEGKRLGFIEGKTEGKAELLLAQMRRRFGPVPEPWRQVVLAAAPAQLDAWADAIFDAASIEALLASRPH